MMNTQIIEKALQYGKNFDVVKKEISNKKVMIYISSLVNESLVNDLISGNYYSDSLLLNGNVTIETKLTTIVSKVLSGCLLFVDKNTYYIVDLRAYPNRSIQEPDSEKSVKGSHDGFTESLNINTGLIRRRIKDIDFTCVLLSVGNKSQTSVTINYIKTEKTEKLVSKIKNKINKLNVDSLILADKSLSELVFDQGYQIFPKVRFSERPDVASIHILKGYVVLLIDTSSSCIIVPASFFELNEQLEEYQLPPLISSFNRIFRFICIILGLYVYPLWFLICISKIDSFSFFLVIENIDKNRLFVEIMCVQIFLMAIRLASFNTPSVLSTSMSLVATIILSGVAADLGLVSAEVVFYGALSSICTYSISNYETSRAINMWSLIMIIAIGIGGSIGFVISSTILFISLVSIKSFGQYYLYPLIPLDLKKLFITLFKVSAKSNKTGKVK